MLLRYAGVIVVDKGEEETPEIFVANGIGFTPVSNVVPRSGEFPAY